MGVAALSRNALRINYSSFSVARGMEQVHAWPVANQLTACEGSLPSSGVDSVGGAVAPYAGTSICPAVWMNSTSIDNFVGVSEGQPMAIGDPMVPSDEVN